VDYAGVAKKVRRKAPLALSQVEKLTALATQGDLDAGLKAETDGLHAIFSSADALEGMTALLERRRPAFASR